MTNFWDMRDRVTRPGGKAVARADAAAGARVAGDPRDAHDVAASGDAGDPPRPAAPASILTVTQLTAHIKRVLADGLPGQLIVRGEVGQWRQQAGSGHCYFNLKDDAATLDCKMWRGCAETLKFEPRAGQELIAFGRIDVWAPRGQYSLVCDRLEPVGQGALELAFRQTVEKLRAEGLFDAARKRPLPPYPQRVAILTSPQAAAYADVLKVLGRFKHLELLLYAVPVQGAGAAAKIAEALEHVGRRHRDVGGIDVVLLVRGGGSAEDLWAFNEEAVARALAGMTLPVVVGVGHETDTTVADLAADVRAHTPTEAAQLLVQRWRTAPDAVDRLRIVLRREWRDAQRARRDRLRASAAHETFRRPTDGVNRRRQLVDEQGHALAASARRLARETGEQLRAWSLALHAHHPRQRVALDRRRVAELGARLDNALSDLRDERAQRLATARAALDRAGSRPLYDARDALARLDYRLNVNLPTTAIAAARQRAAWASAALNGAGRQWFAEVARRAGELRLRLDLHGPQLRLGRLGPQLDALAARLTQVGPRQPLASSARLAAAAGRLTALDPSAVLGRGYSITFVARTGALLRAASDARPGEVLLTRTADGWDPLESTCRHASLSIL